MSRAVDVVIIGLNSAKTLGDCIGSVRQSGYPPERLSVIYADGGSTDGSQDLALSLGAQVIDVTAETPTPGRQRNAGWKAGSAPLVQFLDSDTILDPQWLVQAENAISGAVVAVCGDRREKDPGRSRYNWITDQEWNPPPGPAEAFGGDVLILRSVLEATGGYDDDLIAGEDPELSFRIGRAGHTIQKLPLPMTRHDIAMTKFRQYWKRAYRTGHAYAEVNQRHPDRWSQEVRRIAVRTGFLGIAVAALAVAPFWPWALVLAATAAAVFFRPRLLRVGNLQKTLSLTKAEAVLYSWHVSFVVVPQFLGMVRFWWGRWLSRPLTNRRILKVNGV